MTNQIIIECIGYLGSLLVVISMLMTSVKKLRIINTIGGVIFTAYAFIIRSYPTAFMNLCLVIINIYGIIKIKKKEKDYQIIECYKDESIVKEYLKAFESDILKFFPTFKNDGVKKNTFLVCSDSRPIGLIVGTLKDVSTFDIELDYTIPQYRDCSVGSFLYNYLETNWGFTTFLFSVDCVNHEGYLLKMGFVKEDDHYIRVTTTMFD